MTGQAAMLHADAAGCPRATVKPFAPGTSHALPSSVPCAQMTWRGASCVHHRAARLAPRGSPQRGRQAHCRHPNRHGRRSSSSNSSSSDRTCQQGAARSRSRSTCQQEAAQSGSRSRSTCQQEAARSRSSRSTCQQEAARSRVRSSCCSCQQRVPSSCRGNSGSQSRIANSQGVTEAWQLRSPRQGSSSCQRSRSCQRSCRPLRGKVSAAALRSCRNPRQPVRCGLAALQSCASSPI